MKVYRFLLFNIAYATGPPRGPYHSVVSAHRYLRSERHHIEHITKYIREQEPDIAGLVEVERGSIRNRRVDQVAVIARSLSHHYSYACKYGKQSLYRFIPILRRQGNVLLARESLARRNEHFFPVGAKRLIMEAEVGGLRVLLVHLAVTWGVRRRQIKLLHDIIGEPGDVPTLLAGDFNAFSGHGELDELLEHTGLRTLNETHRPTFPSYAPRKELDFILCSPHITVHDTRIDSSVRLSDHLPLVADIAF